MARASPPTEATAAAFAEILSDMKATPPELEANALEAISAAWSLVNVVVALFSFLQENTATSSNRMIDNLKVFIFNAGVMFCNIYVTLGG